MTGQSYAVPVPKGYRVGPWEVREALASGAFATVYAARLVEESDPEMPSRAALKFLPTGTRTPRQLRHMRELTEREVELLGRLRAPRLIRMYDTLTVDDPGHPELDGATVLVLEQAEGSLDTVLEHEPRPESGPALLAQVCEGLHQLHHAGWVHGDLKPANVLLLKDGSVRLADFNMAAELEGTHAYAPAFATPDYTPPELLWPEIDERGTRIRPTADVWAFGVLAHVVLTGSFPLPGGSTEARTDAATRYARGAEELRLRAAGTGSSSRTAAGRTSATTASTTRRRHGGTTSTRSTTGTWQSTTAAAAGICSSTWVATRAAWAPRTTRPARSAADGTSAQVVYGPPVHRRAVPVSANRSRPHGSLSSTGLTRARVAAPRGTHVRRTADAAVLSGA
jgi:serine/threonine protein kinase